MLKDDMNKTEVFQMRRGVSFLNHLMNAFCSVLCKPTNQPLQLSFSLDPRDSGWKHPCNATKKQWKKNPFQPNLYHYAAILYTLHCCQQLQLNY